MRYHLLKPDMTPVDGQVYVDVDGELVVKLKDGPVVWIRHGGPAYKAGEQINAVHQSVLDRMRPAYPDAG